MHVDLKTLNQSLLMEVHPLPKVDEILAPLIISGAKVLNANSGFWQIPLSPHHGSSLHSSHQLEDTASKKSHLAIIWSFSLAKDHTLH